MDIDDLNDEHIMFNYVGLSTGIEKIIPNSKFKLSCLKDTNDPREYAFKMLGAVGSNLSDNFIELNDNANTKIDKIIRFDYKVFFLCSNNYPKITKKDGSVFYEELIQFGWQKSRMWSQYGQNHTGLCLVFNVDFLKNQLMVLGEHQYNKADFVNYTLQNYYEEGRNFIDGDDLKNEKLDKYPIKHVFSRIKKLMFTKNLDYRDESEFRIAIYDPKNNHNIIDINGALVGLIIGHNTPKVYHNLINDLCMDKNIDCYKMDWSQGQGRVFKYGKKR